MRKIVLSILVAGFSSALFAHPGHDIVGNNFASAYAGFIHPFTGLDHLLVMLAIGIWASKLGGKARWQLPLTFLFSMAIGAVLGLAGITFSGVETAIAASVMAMGLLLAINLPISAMSRIGLVAFFAIFHGLAHGVELYSQQSFYTLTGMLLATALLHGLGLLMGYGFNSQRVELTKWLQNAVAFMMVMAGGYLFLA